MILNLRVTWETGLVSASMTTGNKVPIKSHHSVKTRLHKVCSLVPGNLLMKIILAIKDFNGFTLLILSLKG